MAKIIPILVQVFLIITAINGQEFKTMVKEQLTEAVKVTKEGLGIPVRVQGQSGYTVPESEAGNSSSRSRSNSNNSGQQNLTFVLSARDLENDVDPFVIISYREFDGSMVNIGSTESAGLGVNNPNWTQPFWYIWKKSTEQELTFKAYNHNDNDRLIGEVSIDVDKYIEEGQEVSLDLVNATGNILVEKTTPVKFKLSAKNLRRADEFNGKSDVYVKVYYRNGANGKDTKFYTTTTIDNVENADWGDVVHFVNYQKGKEQYLNFKVRDADSWTKDDHLGEVLVDADTIFNVKLPQTMYLEKSGEHSTLTIVPV